MNHKLFVQSAVIKTAALLLACYLHQGTCQVLQESQSIRILELEPSSSSVTIPCIFSDGAKHPLYLFYKRQLISTHENDTFDPKKGFVVTLDEKLPLRGVVYECRVPGASWGSGGQYKIVRVVPSWGVRTTPQNRRVNLHSGQDLNISCSSDVSNWTPLTLLRNFSDTVSSCTTSSKITSCSLLAAKEHVGGQYLCIAGSAPSNVSLFQSQIVASWHVHVLQSDDRVQVQLNETGTDQSKSVTCTVTKNGRSTLESCECKNETHCVRLRDQLSKSDSCKPISQSICNASATTENPVTDASGTTKRVTVVTNMQTSHVYRCFAKIGGDQTINCAQDVRVVDPPEPAPPYVIIIVVVISLLLLVTIGLALFYRQKFVIEKFKVQKLTEREIYDFINGNQNEIDNQKDMAEQAHLLPYNRSLEFPMNRLHMEKQLGSGAYGTVYKAQAFGLFDRESEEATIVAVKTIVPHADDMFFRALLMELKIMAYIGKHVNVVSLLGAVTENIEMREVYLVMEYCRYGNLHEFLNKNVNVFKSEVTGGRLSATVRTQRNEFPSDAGSTGGSTHLTTGSPVYENAWEMTAQESRQGADFTEGEPLWRTNFQGDGEDSDLAEFNTTTLISWSLQMARGMAYLASKRVIHGDLATRNVLIADCHVVKVADFGLARQVYQNPEYTKTQKNPLPVKWMAIESLTRMAFSSQSDVWAFGITLWEMFSLGETPYQGMQIGEEFVERLKAGYRMKRPPHCPREVFAWMKKCWEADPNDRPTFDQICTIFAEILTKKNLNYANVFSDDDGEPTYGNI